MSISPLLQDHWNYFLSIENDLEEASRYVEFSLNNYSIYSLEFARILLSTSSEIDVISKLICEKINPDKVEEIQNGGEGRRGRFMNMDDYRSIIPLEEKINISESLILIPRFKLEMKPWKVWLSNINPQWWKSYNNVKHKRNEYFQEATLENCLNSVAGLMSLLQLYSILLQASNTETYEGDSLTSLLVSATRVLVDYREPRIFEYESKYYHEW